MKKLKKTKDMAIMKEGDGKIVLFYPDISKESIIEVNDTLRSRWLGQGPKVEKFEAQFSKKFSSNLPSIANLDAAVNDLSVGSTSTSS